MLIRLSKAIREYGRQTVVEFEKGNLLPHVVGDEVFLEENDIIKLRERQKYQNWRLWKWSRK